MGQPPRVMQKKYNSPCPMDKAATIHSRQVSSFAFAMRTATAARLNINKDATSQNLP